MNYQEDMGFPGDSVVGNLPANAGDIGDVDLIPGLARTPGKGNVNLRQFSCLENSEQQKTEKPGRLQSMGSQRIEHN